MFYFHEIINNESIKELNEAANLGNAEALLTLGLIYKYGYKTFQNYRKSIDYLQKSIEANNAKAVVELWDLYKESFKHQDIKRFFKVPFEDFLEKEIKIENNDVLLEIWKIYNKHPNYSKCSNMNKDQKKALNYLEKAANLENAEALLTLGLICITKKDKEFLFSQNIKEPILVVFQYLSLKYDDCLQFFDILHKNNNSINVDSYQEYLQRAADLGNAGALLSLGFIYKYGCNVYANNEKSIECFLNAIHLTNNDKILISALTNLIEIFKNQNINIFCKKALNYFKKEAKIGNNNALIILCLIYKYGCGIPPNKCRFEKYLNQLNKKHKIYHEVLDLLKSFLD